MRLTVGRRGWTGCRDRGLEEWWGMYDEGGREGGRRPVSEEQGQKGGRGRGLSLGGRRSQAGGGECEAV